MRPPAAAAPADELLFRLERLHAVVREAPLRLEVPGVAEARRQRDEIAGQLVDHVLPRLRHLDAPLLTVVGGSTGAGKSTIVNSLVGTEISPPGVLRPTTRSPVLACAPADLRWFTDDRILPGLARTTGASAAGRHGLHLVPVPSLPTGLALLDAPDIDSVATENRLLAAQLLAAADLWLFVTTAARYADAVPWQYLRDARERSTALGLVLNRVPPEATREVTLHLQSMLDEAGLGGTPVFTVLEGPLEQGRLPEAQVAPLRRWIVGLVSDTGARNRVIRSTLDGALASLPVRVGRVASAVDEQTSAATALRASVSGPYRAAMDGLAEDVASGALLRGEVLARWQEFVGAGELMRSLESGIGRLRDRIRAALTGKPGPGREVQEAVSSGLVDLVVAAADTAADRTATAWSHTPAGAALLGPDVAGLRRADPHLPRQVAEEVRAWQGDVLELVRRQGASRRTAARVASSGVNAVGVLLMIAVFVQTGGLTGGEVVIAGGTATVSQKLLEAVFGEQAVRGLTAEARGALLDRMERLLRDDAGRFLGRLDATSPPLESSERLRETAAGVTGVRW